MPGAAHCIPVSNSYFCACMLQKGTVYKSTGSSYRVKLNGIFTDCVLAGKYRLEGVKSTNPLAVGDLVSVNTEGHPAVIENIEPRRNYIIRRSVNLSKRTHIIASNLDRVMIMASISMPRTSTGFIDRILVTCEAYDIPAMIVFNKSDLLDEDERAYRDELIAEYSFLGYPSFATSATGGEGTAAVHEMLRGKNTLIIGHSGVGKSSLMNRIEPGLNLRTQSISRKHEKGMHTTTFAEMHDLHTGGTIIDTPGVKEFGLVRMHDTEIGDYFPEILALKDKCRFNNCTHRNEPGCAVQAALAEGGIADFRYRNYLNILESNLYQPWADD